MARLNTLELLSKLITIPSLSEDGMACQKIVHLAQSNLKQNGIESKIITRGGKPILLWGQLNLQDTKWLINTHLDVVPAASTQFVAKITRDKIWGRGAVDTKWASAILLNLTKEQVELATNKNLSFMLVVDEEVGGESTKAILQDMSSLEGAIFLEPTQEKIVLEAKGIMQIKIKATGKSCHGSRPWDGENAIEKLMRGLATFRMHHPIPISETKATTFNFSQINGGSAINQVPEKSELLCDVRYNPNDKPAEVIKLLESSFLDCQIEKIKVESPINCDSKALVTQKLVKAMKTNSLNPLFGFDHGSSDARHGTALGIPSLVFGIKGKGLHSTAEWGSIKSINKVSSILDTWISLL